MNSNFKDEFYGYERFLPENKVKWVVIVRLANSQVNFLALKKLGLPVEEDLREELTLCKERFYGKGFEIDLLEIRDDFFVLGVICSQSIDTRSISARLGYISKRLLKDHKWINAFNLEEGVRPSLFIPEYHLMSRADAGQNFG